MENKNDPNFAASNSKVSIVLGHKICRSKVQVEEIFPANNLT